LRGSDAKINIKMEIKNVRQVAQGERTGKKTGLKKDINGVS